MIRGLARQPRRQFVGPSFLNRRHPLSTGLLAAYAPNPWNGFKNLVGNGGNLTPKAGANLIGTGTGYSTSGMVTTQGADALIGTTSPLSWGGDCSILWVGTLFQVPSATNPTLFGIQNNNTDVSPWASLSLDLQGGTATGVAFNYNTTGSAPNGVDWTATFTAGAPLVIIVTATTGAVHLYINGVDQGAGTTPTTAFNATQAYTSTATVCFGAYTPVAARFINGHSSLGLLWNRALTLTEVNWIASDPYQVFADQNPHYRIAAARWFDFANYPQPDRLYDIVSY